MDTSMILDLKLYTLEAFISELSGFKYFPIADIELSAVISSNIALLFFLDWDFLLKGFC